MDIVQAFPYDIKIFIQNVSADRVTYGSDGPYQSAAVEQLKLRSIGLSEEDLRKGVQNERLKDLNIQK